MASKKNDYRRLLAEELENRKLRNRGYSLRAFARDLGFPVSKLSEVLRGKVGLSAKSGERIADALRLSDEEKRWFLLSIAAAHDRSPVHRAKARARMRELLSTGEFDEIGLEKFKVIADWYHFALLELTEVPEFRSDARWIARRLKIEEAQAAAAIERLIVTGLLKRDVDGHLRQTHENLATPNGIPSREIRRHHSQILKKADEALDEVPLSERDFSAMTMLFSAEQMEEARRLIKEFRRRFDALMKENGGERRRVYGFSIQLFPMDRPEQEGL